MRRMYSEKQIKNLIEKDLSNVVVTKGVYTNNANVHMSKISNCITITGYVQITNSNEEPTELIAFTFDNIFSNNITDGDLFVLTQDSNDNISSSYGYISFDNNTVEFVIKDVPTGESYYYFDFDLIDTEPLPVEDYPGE